MPNEVDVTKEVEAAYDKLKKNNQLPNPQDISPKEFKERLTSTKKFEKYAAVSGNELIWEFDNVKPADPNGSVFIRYKYAVSVEPPDGMVYGIWAVGDVRQIKYGLELKTQIYKVTSKSITQTYHEIEVPASVIAEDGYLAVAFLNNPELNSTIVIFPPEEGLELLYKADSFGANFLRAVLLLIFRLIFFATLGILASSFLSFPVALLFCFSVFFTTHFTGFLLESFSSLGEEMSRLYYYSISWLIKLLPQFDKFNPTKFLIPARLLSWSLLAKAAFFGVCVKSVLMLILALIIFRFKEIAKIII